jgi:hypothetical protein
MAGSASLLSQFASQRDGMINFTSMKTLEGASSLFLASKILTRTPAGVFVLFGWEQCIANHGTYGKESELRDFVNEVVLRVSSGGAATLFCLAPRLTR